MAKNSKIGAELAKLLLLKNINLHMIWLKAQRKYQQIFLLCDGFWAGMFFFRVRALLRRNLLYKNFGIATAN